MPLMEAAAATGAGAGAASTAGTMISQGAGAIAALGGMLGNAAGNIWSNITGQANTEATNRTNKEIALWNMLQQQKTNEMNYGMFKENLDYQKALNEQIMQREDTSYQRTVADMRKAGLNPLTMSGLNGSGGNVANVSPYSQEPITNNYMPETFRPNLQINNLTMEALQTMNELQNFQIGEDFQRQQKAIADSAEAKAKEDTMTLMTKIGNAKLDSLTKKALAEDIMRNMDFNEEHGIYNGMSETDRNTRFIKNAMGQNPNKVDFFMSGNNLRSKSTIYDNASDYAKERLMMQLGTGVIDTLNGIIDIKKKLMPGMKGK